jgi:putative membrane protein
MKNYKTKMLQVTLILAVMLGVSACNSNKAEDTKVIAEDQNEEKIDNKKSEKDAQFLVNAAEITRSEISLGQLATQFAMTSYVKELGKMMEEAHTKSLADLTELAKTKNITIPDAQTDDGQEAYKKLSKTKGKEFDKAYAELMVKKHNDAISLFENASTESTDIDIRAWATSTLPNLRMHLDQSLMCQKENNRL